jgi:hypothetical protein
MHLGRRCIPAGPMSNAVKARMWSAVEIGGCRVPPVGLARAPVPVGAGPQRVEHLAGAWHDEGLGIRVERGDVSRGEGRVDGARDQRWTSSSAVSNVNSCGRGNASQSPVTVTANAPAMAAVDSRSRAPRRRRREAR